MCLSEHHNHLPDRAGARERKSNQLKIENPQEKISKLKNSCRLLKMTSPHAIVPYSSSTIQHGTGNGSISKSIFGDIFSTANFEITL